MAVSPRARGNRLGELLLEVVESFAAESNLSRLFLSTTPFLDRAIALYRNYGFERTEEGPHELFGTPLFTMEKLRK
jgi:ribosomal protein S18 acetylase RimI-like enzyme